MLAGRKPFTGEREELLVRHLREPPGPLGGNVPADLAEIALRMLEKSPAQRFKDFQELTARLWNWLAAHGGTGSRHTVPLLAPDFAVADARREPPPRKRGWFSWG
jgi:hypothetical protein